VTKELAFVVRGAAGMDIAVLERRGERRSFPSAQGFAWDDVIVAVDDQRGTAWGTQPLGVDDGISAIRNNANPIEADGLQVVR